MYNLPPPPKKKTLPTNFETERFNLSNDNILTSKLFYCSPAAPFHPNIHAVHCTLVKNDAVYNDCIYDIII